MYVDWLTSVAIQGLLNFSHQVEIDDWHGAMGVCICFDARQSICNTVVNTVYVSQIGSELGDEVQVTTPSRGMEVWAGIENEC